MRLHQKIIAGGLVFAGLVGLIGWDNTNNNQSQQLQKPSYFASVPAGIRTGTAIQAGDFDGDGDLDLIVGAVHDDQAKLYFLRNESGTFSDPSYFASVPAGIRTGTAIQAGDFDGDGDLDLIVGAVDTSLQYDDQVKLYRFNNDGKGNFSQ